MREPEHHAGDDLASWELSAEKRWRRIRGFKYLAKVIEGVKFRDGIGVDSETDDSRSAA